MAGFFCSLAIGESTCFNNGNGMPIRTLGIIWDVTQKDELTIAEQNELAEVTLESIGDAVMAANEVGSAASALTR